MTNKDSFPAHATLEKDYRFRLVVPDWNNDTATLDFEQLINEFQQLRQLADEMAEGLSTCKANQGFMNDEMWFDYDKVKLALTKYNSIIKGI